MTAPNQLLSTWTTEHYPRGAMLVWVFLATCFVSTPALSITGVSFPTPAPYYEISGAGPNDIAAGDVDNDGDIDIVVSSFGSGNSNITSLLNDGNGNLADNKSFALLNGAHGISLALMNNDAFLDVVVAVRDYSGGNIDGNGPDSGVDIFYGDGAGRFGINAGLVNTPNFHQSLSGTTAVVSADFDGDGVNDLAVTRQLGGVAVYLGQIDAGSGVLSFTGPSTVGSGTAVDILVDDFDGDSKLDIATPGAVYFGDGAGGFNSGTSIGGYWAVASGDINGDAYKDIAVLSGTTFGTTLRVKLGNADRSFTDLPAYTDTGTNIDFNDVYIADLNLDGFGDVVISDGRSNVVRVLLQGCDGALQAPISLPTPLGGPIPVFAANLNDADSYPDIVTALNNANQTPYAAVFTQAAPVTAAGSMSLCSGSYSVVEPDGLATNQATVVVTRSGGTQGAIVATINTSDGSASAGSDYTAITDGTVSMADGVSRQTFTVDVLGDNVYEGAETFNIALSGASASPNPDNATINIVENDPTPVLSFATNVYSVAENVALGVIELTVTRSNDSAAPVSVNYATSNISATGGAMATTPNADYVITSGTLSFAPGEMSHTISVPIIDDGSFETNETFNVTLSSFTGGAVPGRYISAQVTINNDDPEPAGILEIHASSVNISVSESGPVATVFVTRSGGSNGIVTATYETVDGSAVSIGANPDFTAAASFVTFASGSTAAQPITIMLNDDALVEPTQSFTISLTGTTGGASLGTQTSATVNILDNDNVSISVDLAANVAGASETGPSNGQFTLTLSSASTSATTVNYDVGGNAVAGSDYTALSGSVNIPAGSTTATIDVAVLDDVIVDGDRSVIVTLTSTNNVDVTLGTQTSDTVTIADNDSATVSISKLLDASEPNSNGEFSVSLSAASATDTVVSYNVTGSTATPGNDYNTLSGSVTIPAGASSATIPVVVLDDMLVEGDETVVVNLSGTNNVAITVGAASSDTVTISDNDNTQVSVATTTNASEPNVNGLFTVSQSQVSASDTIVNYNLTGSTATPGNDYNALSGSVTIPAGASSATISVVVLDDMLVEGDETVVVNLSGTNNVAITVGAASSDTVTISDDDNGQVSVATTNNASEPNVNGLFTVTQSQLSATDTIVNYNLTGSTATPGAGNDYNALSGSVTIPSGASSATIAVVVLDDMLVEGDETVVVNLSGTDNVAITVGAASSDTVTISDNDNTEVSVATTTNASEPNVNGLFTVTQSQLSATDTIVNYNLTGSTATPGNDYNALSGSVTIPAGASSATISVVVLDDMLIEGDETVVVNLSGTDNVAITVGAAGSDTVTISDDDNGQVSVATTNNASEPNVNGLFTVSQSQLSATDTIVNYNVTGSTATPGTGSDYNALSGSVTILAGASSATIPVTVLDDTLIEGDETVVVNLSGTDNVAITVGAASSDTLTISDNDNGQVSIVASSNANEPNVDGLFTVTQSQLSATDTIVNYNVTGSTATPGTGNDYNTLSGTVTIPAGASSATIPVTVLDDTLIEGDETVVVNLSGTDNAAITVGAASSDTVTISDNDNGQVSVATTNHASEPNVNGLFTVTQSQLSTTDTLVTYSVAGSATPGIGNDYSTLSGSVTIIAGNSSATIAVNVLDDTAVEGSETVVVSLVGSSNAAITADVTPATLNISDDDGGNVSIVASGQAAEPLSHGLFTLTQSVLSVTDTVVSYSISGTASAGPAGDNTRDYDQLSGSATILAGTTQATINVTVNDDSVVELPETVVVTLTSTDSVTIGVNVAPATVTITDNDSSIASISSNKANASEPTVNGQFTVTLSQTSASDTIVSYSVAGSAQAGTDFSGLPGTLTIPALATSAVIDVVVIDNLIIDGVRNVELTLTSTDSANISVDLIPATVTIASDDVASVSVAAISDASEPNVNGEFSFTQTASSTTNTIINYAVSGTAIPGMGNDYVSLSGSVTILAGNTTVTLPVVVYDDILVEPSEDVIITLSSTNNTDISVDATPAAVNIIDNEQVDKLQFEFSNYSVDENTPGTIDLTVQRVGGLNGTVRVSYVTGSLQNTAQGGVDYTSASGVLTFADQVATQTITLTILDDSLYEGDELFTVALNNPSNLAMLGVPASTTVSILDDESPPIAGSLQFEQTAYSVDENAVQIDVVVSRMNGSDGDITVDYVSGDGSATAGSDYSSVSGTLTFADADITSKTISILIANDTLYEGNENFTVSLNNPQAVDPAAQSLPTLGIPADTTVTIIEDDAPPPAGIVQFEQVNYTIGENQLQVELRVTRSSGTAGDIEVDYVTGGGNATVDEDYSNASGVVTFQDGDDVPKSLIITILDDVIYEGDEFFNVSLLNPRNGISTVQNTPPSLGTVSVTAVSITDDDPAPVYGSLIIEPNSYTIAENAATVSLNVQRVGGSDGTITVEYATGNPSDTASADEDYVAVPLGSGLLTFAGGEISQTIVITLQDDIVYEGNEQFSVYLANPAGGAQLGTQSTAIVMITENDPIPVAGALQFEYDTASNPYYIVGEQQANVSLTVTRVGGNDSQASVDFYTEDDTAMADTDYVAQSGQLIFEPGVTSQSIIIGIIDDDIFTGQRSFYVNLSNPSATVLGSESRALVNITEDEQETPTVAPSTKKDKKWYAGSVDPVTLLAMILIYFSLLAIRSKPDWKRQLRSSFKKV